jgi:class 3 adenylate cyclase
MVRNLVRNFEQPDDRREFSNGSLDLIKVGPLTVGRETLHPGWRWSVDVKPIAGTERCEFHHVGIQVSGRWACEDREGNVVEVGPGEIFDTPPGHDAWVVGDEPCVTLDFQGISDWAMRSSASRVLTTVLFADIVESTPLVERIGDAAWRRLLDQYRETVGIVLAGHHGVLVDTAGDGLLARFDSPLAAVRSAVAITEAAERLAIRTRVGVHTGEVELTDDALTGLALHIGARVLAEAGPGEVVVTATTHDLTADTELVYESRGSVELRGVSGARALYVLHPASSAS